MCAARNLLSDATPPGPVVTDAVVVVVVQKIIVNRYKFLRNLRRTVSMEASVRRRQQ